MSKVQELRRLSEFSVFIRLVERLLQGITATVEKAPNLPHENENNSGCVAQCPAFAPDPHPKKEHQTTLFLEKHIKLD